MRLKRIHLDICRKCQVEHRCDDGHVFLADPVCCFSDWGDFGIDAMVYWSMGHAACGTITCAGKSLARNFNNFVRNGLNRPFVDSGSPRENMEQSIQVLDEAMMRFPCHCIINDENCPYLAEQILMDINGKGKADAE